MSAIASELSMAESLEENRTAPSRHAGDQTQIVQDPAFPKAQGLYDPSRERDACGVGFVADMHDRRTHTIVQQGLKILENLDHRGAVGADPTETTLRPGRRLASGHETCSHRRRIPAADRRTGWS